MSTAGLARRRPLAAVRGRTGIVTTLLLGVTVALATVVLAIDGIHSALWQNDENLYTGVARHVANVGVSGLFEWGFYQKGIQRLTVWLLAPGFALWESPNALVAGHILQALVFATVAWPTYKLARGLGLAGGWALVPAVLVLLVPWAVLATSFLTEPVAYAAFAWALYFGWRALVAPSKRADAVALAAIGVTLLSRTGFIVLLPVLPAAALLYSGRAVWRDHALIVIATGLGLAFVAALTLRGHGVTDLTGVYGTPDLGRLGDLLHKDGVFMSRVVAGTGYLPAMLAVGWLITGVRRRIEPARRAFAVLALLAIGALLVSLGAATPDERYVVYFAVPVFVAATASLVRREVSAGGLAIGAAVCLALVLRERWDLNPDDFSFFTYPAEAFHHRVVEGRLNVRPLSALPGSPDLKLAVALVAAAAVAYAARRRPVLAGAVLAAIVGWQFAQTDYTLHMFATKVGVGPSLRDRAFIDRELPDGAFAGLWGVGLGDTPDLVYAFRGAEFWNTQLKAIVSQEPAPITPYPASGDGLRVTFTVNFATGQLRPEALMPGHLIMAPGFTPIGIAVGPSQPNVLGLQYVAVQRPFRMRWMAQGVANDNWMKPGRDVKLRVYAEPHARRTCGVLTIAAPPGFSGRRPFVLRTARAAIARGALRDQEARRLRLVVPPGRAHADFRLTVPGPGVPFTGARKVSLRLNDMSVAACG